MTKGANARLASIAALTLMLAACGDDSRMFPAEDNATPDGTVDPTSEVTLLIASVRRTDVNADVVLDGEITLLGDCVGLGSRVAVFPEGSTWSTDAPAVELADGSVISIGAEVVGEGAVARISDFGTSEHATEFADALRKCATPGVVEVATFSQLRSASDDN